MLQASERISQSPKASAHEAALYGVLSSNVQAVYPVCRGWTDHVWALGRRSATIDSRPLYEPCRGVDSFVAFAQMCCDSLKRMSMSGLGVLGPM